VLRRREWGKEEEEDEDVVGEVGRRVEKKLRAGVQQERLEEIQHFKGEYTVAFKLQIFIDLFINLSYCALLHSHIVRVYSYVITEYKKAQDLTLNIQFLPSYSFLLWRKR
jgi:hypothetical protein